MAQARNTFTKSKMNKDLDARLMRSDEYRDARNIQVSRSEGANVGSLENALGNELVLNINTLTSSTNQKCIGYLTDETNNYVYLFTTDNTSTLGFNKLQKSFILRYDTVSNIGIVLVSGSFLNFHQNNPIIGVNLLEGLLFFTDNFNQPRVINVITAANDNTYYQTEDQISVAKYNPYQAIELWQEVDPATSPASYETTMQDVTTPYLPNGGSAVTTQTYAAGVTSITVDAFENNILPDALLGTGSLVSYIDGANNLVSTNARALTFAYNSPNWDLTISSGLPTELPNNTTLVFNPNPYYDGQFAGDPDYLEDKFVRFSYRFKFEDNQYSIFAPFTQIAFIPKQDGYFLYVKNDALNFPETNDLDSAYRSTVVSFMENKVDLVKLRIPLPFSKSDIVSRLKISEMDILYKESNGLAVKVIDTISIADIIANPTVEPNVFTYNYNSKKPYKTLPENNLTRVYDKIPVKAFSQEIASNRIIYGNFQDKHTPPVSLDYSVTVGAKSDFDLNITTATTNGAADVGVGVAFPIDNATAVPELGSIATGAGIPPNASVTAATATSLTLNKAVDIADGVVITFNLVGPDTNTVTKVEYPNSTLKQNRNYQVGVMLSDRYGRTSTVLLSSNKEEVALPGGLTFVGDTVYSAYLDSGTRPDQWPGNSLKVLFNQPIGPEAPNPATGWPGIYKGPNYDGTGFENPNSLYNPLGWYSYKIVVKQTEQEYYNVYLPGIMAAYPEDVTLELSQTSHVVLINDNINKVPRDLSEVGPTQKQFRSSVGLFGRVNNTATAINFNATSGGYPNIGESNSQYYPKKGDDVVSTISTMQDLFDYDPSLTPAPNYFPQFYSYESNPLIARISTEKQIGQIATTNYSPVSGEVAVASTSDEILLKNVIGEGPSVTGTINGLQTNVPAGTAAIFNTFTVIPSVGSVAVGLGIPSETKVTAATTTSVTFDKNTQFVNGTTVTFTLVQIALGDSVRGGGLPNDTIVIAPGFTPSSSVVVTTSTSASTSNVINVASSTNIQPNQYVSAAGIPEGTIVQSKNGSTITVSNVVDIANGVSIDFRLPGKIKVGRLNDATPPVPVATPVTVAFDAEITIVSETTPGLQYLAVMETEPVESLLDIFWETTSTGLIEDLNTLILNSSEGGANFSSFNTSPFTEALATTQPILNADFTLVDFFGVVIPPANITSLTIDIVRNGNNTNVTNFFTLNSIGAGYFNVKTTATYYSSIFFNNDANLRTFTITFISVVTDSGNSTTTTYNETITLGNVDPTIPTATPAVGSTIQTNRYEQSLAVLDGVNGANNTTLRTQDLTWEIISVFNTTSAPTTDIGPNGSDLGYFTIPTTVASNNLRATLTNSSGGNMPPEVYQVNLRLSDALASVNAQYIFNMLIEPNVVRSLTWQIVCDGETQADNFPAVEIQITDGSASPTQQNGWYIFPVPWGTLVNVNGGNVITIDRTNARLTNPSGAACPSYGDAFFSPTSSAAVRALWTASDCTCSSGNTGNITSTSNIDVTGYLFEII